MMLSLRLFMGMLLLLLLPIVSAQFFFENMFGGHHGQQQQQQRPSGSSQWQMHAESIPCGRYLCPGTLDCVEKPIDCPCPNIQDVKCTIPDSDSDTSGTVVCVRGAEECTLVEQLSKRVL